MSYFKDVMRHIAAEARKEMTIQSAPPTQRKSASEKINESRALKTGLNGIAMFVLICLGVAVLVF